MRTVQLEPVDYWQLRTVMAEMANADAAAKAAREAAAAFANVVAQRYALGDQPFTLDMDPATHSVTAQ